MRAIIVPEDTSKTGKEKRHGSRERLPLGVARTPIALERSPTQPRQAGRVIQPSRRQEQADVNGDHGVDDEQEEHETQFGDEFDAEEHQDPQDEEYRGAENSVRACELEFRECEHEHLYGSQTLHAQHASKS